MVYFQFHLNCQNIHDKKGDNEFYLMRSSHNTANACFYLKSREFNLNRLNLKGFWMQSRKRCFIFNITSIFRIFMTIKVIVCSEVSSISPQEKLLGLIYLSQRYLHNSMIFNELKHTNLRLYLLQTSVQSSANFSPRRFCLGNYEYYYFTTNTSHESSLFLKVWILFLAGV